MTFRPLVAPALVLAMGASTPALAQVNRAELDMLNAQQNELWAQQQLANQRAIDLHNQMEAQDARMQTELRLQQLRDQGQPWRAPVILPRAKPSAEPSPSYPSIPDAALAASRARVMAAAANRR